MRRLALLGILVLGTTVMAQAPAPLSPQEKE